MKKIYAWVALIVGAAVALSACVPQVRESDNGDWSYARQVFPILYGRKARGHEELKVIVDLIRLTGREATVRGMMQSEEFVDHWSEFLVNQMQASKQQGGDTQSQTACFPAAINPAGRSEQLAQWVRDNPPDAGGAQCSGASCGTFTMTDLVRSSLQLDDLSPAYRGYLFALQNRPISGNMTTEANQRSSVFKRFESVYLSRRNECLSCHNSAGSVTGPSSQWNRFHALPVFLEQAVYGADTGRVSEKELHALFRVSGVNDGGIAPWGMGSCGAFARPTSDDSQLTTGEVGFLGSAFGRRGSIFDVESQLRRGVNDLRDGFQRCSQPLTPAPTLACSSCSAFTEPALSPAQLANQNAVGTIFTNKQCFNCHSGSGMGGLAMEPTNFAQALLRRASSTNPSQARAIPGCATGTEAGCGASVGALMERLTTTNSSRIMPPSGAALSSTELATVRNWILNAPNAAGCSSCAPANLACGNILRHRFVAGHEALAFMSAMSIVNSVWAEVMGSPLTIDLYFPRNNGQMNVLWNLTEFHFINKNWSLRELLVTVLSYRFFNRSAPVAGAGTSAYELPQLFNPWAEGDPRVPPIAQPGWVPGTSATPVPDASYASDAEPNRPRHFDPMTEAVHRHSARTLLQSAGTALGWGSARRYPDTTYPSAALTEAMGERINDVAPGFKGTNFASLLAWESVHGRCQKPAGSTDWIDRLNSQVPVFDTANPGNPLLVEDIARTIKDWLLNYSSLGGSAPSGMTLSEQAAIAALFGVPDLSTRASTVNDLAGKARRLCGVFLQTPQFLLSGLEPPAGSASTRPRLRVCNGGACTYREICQTYAGAVGENASKQLVCAADSVFVFRVPDLIDIFIDWRRIIDPVCIGGRCGIVLPPKGCRFGDAQCELPPVCNPKIDGCGGPLPPIELAHQVANGKVLVIERGELANSLARQSEARVIRGGKALPTQTEPRNGDWIFIPDGARVQLGRAQSQVNINRLGGSREQKQHLLGPGLYVAVRELLDPAVVAQQVPQRVPSRLEIDTVLNLPTRRFGSGGAPLQREELWFSQEVLERHMRRGESEKSVVRLP